MLDIVFAIFLIGTLVCEVFLVFCVWLWVNRPPAPQIIERISETAQQGERQKAPGDYPEQPRQSKGGSVEAPDIPPEVIAPSLKKPPRPQGGFGSRVSKDDDSSSLHKTD